MSRSDDQRLDDMRDQCAVIGRLVARGRDAFDTDEAIGYAVKRSLEILGEAANTIGEATRASLASIDWHRITRLRIMLAHHYHRVDPEQVWTIAIEEIPRLKSALGPGPQ